MIFLLLFSVFAFCHSNCAAGFGTSLVPPAQTCEDELTARGDALVQTKSIRKKSNTGSHSDDVDVDNFADGSSLEQQGPPVSIIESITRNNITLRFADQPIDETNLNVSLLRYLELTHPPIGKLPWGPLRPPNFSISFLHQIVGRDGVKVINVDSAPERFTRTAMQLAEGGILATSFAATDAAIASDDQLRRGCIGAEDSDRGKCEGEGLGCAKKTEQALADSHRRALLAAGFRKYNWTAILEDDMALFDPHRWSSAFTSAWKALQETSPQTKLVRLSWCMIVSEEEDHQQTFTDAGDFILTKWSSVDGVNYDPGLCTGGYLVHKDIVDEMAQQFPCCGPVDVCYMMWLRQQEEDGNAHGLNVMISMDAKDSRQKSGNITNQPWLGQHGVMYQDRR